MEPLAPPDSHFLSAAEGWLELGNLAEARLELAQIAESLREHPDYLNVCWAIAAHEKDWPNALTFARKLVQLAPDSPDGWLHQAYAMRRVKEGGLQAAWECLFPALKKFPGVALIPYNLSCYACQLLHLDLARDLFKQAMDAGGKDPVKALALQDKDLQPLWHEISNL